MLKDKGLFLKAETQTALWVPWDTVGQLIGDKLEKLLQMTFHVRAEYRDADYWCCEFGTVSYTHLTLPTTSRV